jgi:phosphoribosyl-ATP pyrophosphohydrolase/phosphoribosyl-AMP cyclohydrolase
MIQLPEARWDAQTGLLPAIVQDHITRKVLMLGYFNAQALKKTLEEKKVTFYSRSKERLWTKGESSGHFLHLVDMQLDCDQDSFLVLVNPEGPTCHTGADTCWNESNASRTGFLDVLRDVIHERKLNLADESYTASLFKKGINKVAQKVGEEAVELVIEAKDNNAELFLNEAADLLYHYLVLLEAKEHTLDEVTAILENRHKAKK